MTGAMAILGYCLLVSFPLAVLLLQQFRSGWVWPWGVPAFAAMALCLLPGWGPLNWLPGIAAPRAVAVAAILAVACFSLRERRESFTRCTVLDGLMGLWLLSPGWSVWWNGNPSWAVTVTCEHAVVWLPPYLIGRIAVGIAGRDTGLRNLLCVLVSTAVLVSPLLWIESYLRPSLLVDILGPQWSAAEGRRPLILNRFGPDGHRPSLGVGGLDVVMLYSYATVAALALWWAWIRESDSTSRSRTTLWGAALVAWLFLCTLTCRAVFGSALMFGGCVFLLAMLGSGRLGPRVVAECLAVCAWSLAIIYIASRHQRWWDTDAIADIHDKSAGIAGWLGRTRSIWDRFHQEDLTLIYSELRPVFGAGGRIGRSLNHTGIPGVRFVDGEWLWIYAHQGLVGLSLWLCLGLAAMTYIFRSARQTPIALLVPTTAVLTIMNIYYLDGLANPAPEGWFAIMLGATAAMSASHPRVSG